MNSLPYNQVYSELGTDCNVKEEYINMYNNEDDGDNIENFPSNMPSIPMPPFSFIPELPLPILEKETFLDRKKLIRKIPVFKKIISILIFILLFYSILHFRF